MIVPVVASAVARVTPAARVRRKGRALVSDVAVTGAADDDAGAPRPLGAAFDAAGDLAVIRSAAAPTTPAFRAALLRLKRGG